MDNNFKKIYYYVMCVSAFSKEKDMEKRNAFNYLLEHNGIEFIIECYDAEHTLSIEDAVNDLTLVCKNNGGNIE